MFNNKDNRINLGNLGEDLVVKYLISKNYKIIARNYRFGHLEIDIITSLGKEFVFFEVKTRYKNFSKEFEEDEENLKRTQIYNLKKAINFYCWRRKINLEKVRLDLVVILLGDNKFSLKHYKNILF